MMAITSPQHYLNLMGADGERVWSFIANEVGMKKAQEIAKRVMSNEETPQEAALLKSF